MKIQFNMREYDTNYSPKYRRDDVVTNGKSTYQIVGWDYNERDLPYYKMHRLESKCVFDWLAEEADVELSLV